MASVGSTIFAVLWWFRFVDADMEMEDAKV
jgi:hypothetical protein